MRNNDSKVHFTDEQATAKLRDMQNFTQKIKISDYDETQKSLANNVFIDNEDIEYINKLNISIK